MEWRSPNGLLPRRVVRTHSGRASYSRTRDWSRVLDHHSYPSGQSAKRERVNPSQDVSAPIVWKQATLSCTLFLTQFWETRAPGGHAVGAVQTLPCREGSPHEGESLPILRCIWAFPSPLSRAPGKRPSPPTYRRAVMGKISAPPPNAVLSVPVTLSWEGHQHQVRAMIDSGAPGRLPGPVSGQEAWNTFPITPSTPNRYCPRRQTLGTRLHYGDHLPSTSHCSPTSTYGRVLSDWLSRVPCDLGLSLAAPTQPLHRLASWNQVTFPLSSPLAPSPESQEPINLSRVPSVYHCFQAVFSKSRATSLPPHRSYDCTIDLLPGTCPTRGRIFSLSPPERIAMDTYIKESLAAGIIRASTSPAGTGFFFVGKKDGGLRPCIDYRALNKITVRNRYPLPLMASAFELLQGASIFSKLDLLNAYHLVRIQWNEDGMNGRRPSTLPRVTMSTWWCRSGSPTLQQSSRP